VIDDMQIGGPCPKCGISQVDHAGMTCAEAKKAEDARWRAAWKPMQDAMREALKNAPGREAATATKSTGGGAAALPPVKHKASHIGAPAVFALELALQHLRSAFGHYGCYVVGSSLDRADWRDVDVRYIMEDAEFAKLFPDAGDNWEFDPRWLILTVAISGWLSQQSGLPVDFQFQPQTHANKRHPFKRNAAGIRIKRTTVSSAGSQVK